MASKGRFVWHELLTTDVNAAKAFYSEVIGWKTKVWENNQDYTLLCINGDESVGGVMALPDEVQKAGVPPHWLGHIAVPDLAKATAAAKQHGGEILNQIDVPEVGTFAVTKDPQGAVFSLFQPAGDMPDADMSRLGMVGWNELNTTDYEGAFTFYKNVLGWEETDQMDMGDGMGIYFMFKHAGQEGSMGGMSNMAKLMNIPPNWSFYFQVDDIDAAIKRTESKGGKIINGPMEVPGGGKIANGIDPQGAHFSMYAQVK